MAYNYIISIIREGYNVTRKSKYDRILSLYSKLYKGDLITKSDEANRFGVSERTIQRDIDDIRAFFGNNSLNFGLGKSIVYDKKRNGYILIGAEDEFLTGSECLAGCKILIDSRTLIKSEMTSVIKKLINYTPSNYRKGIESFVLNELFYYCEPKHGKKLLDTIWMLKNYIQNQNIIEISYSDPANKYEHIKKLKPVAILVSEYYFYLAAYIADSNKKRSLKASDDVFPLIFRIDRIKTIKNTHERFSTPYSNKFNEGEFKKRIPFMHSGKLRTVTFTYSGNSLEDVLDKLPTAIIVNKENGIYTISSEVYGDGILAWLSGQNDKINILESDNNI